MHLSKKKFNKKIGSKILKLRKNLSLSQEKFAEKTRTGRTYIGEIERGEKNLSLYKLYTILYHLDIKLKDFFKDVEPSIGGIYMNNKEISNMENSLSVLNEIDKIDYPSLIKALYGHEVKKIKSKDNLLISNLEKAANIAEKNAFEEGIYRSRPNEVGNDMEEYVKNAINHIGFRASTPKKRNGKKQSTGYPDFYCETENGNPFYLEVKTYNLKNINTTQRSFYLSPPNPGHEKINHDAPHVMMSFEIKQFESNVQKNLYKPVSWKILSLYNLQLNLKSEFNSSNREMYNENLIISEK